MAGNSPQKCLKLAAFYENNYMKGVQDASVWIRLWQSRRLVESPWRRDAMKHWGTNNPPAVYCFGNNLTFRQISVFMCETPKLLHCGQDGGLKWRRDNNRKFEARLLQHTNFFFFLELFDISSIRKCCQLM